MNDSGDQGAKVQGDVIRRKVAAARLSPVEGPQQGVPRLWPLALARATRDSLALGLEATSLVTSQFSLTELLDVVPERSLIAVLDGPHDGLGVIILSPAVLAALIEVQTLGQVMPGPAQTRKPTRTDAAMVAGWIDTALHGVEVLLTYDADMPWADGFRYASFLDDARPLGLLLEDVPYRVVTVEVSLAMGLKSGPVLLALPAHGRGRAPKVLAPEAVVPPIGPIFAEEMEERIMAAECTLQAVIARVRMPLSRVLDLTEGAILPLAEAGIDRILVEAADGRPLGEGRLGQHRGHRAVRLMEIADRDKQLGGEPVHSYSAEESVGEADLSSADNRLLRVG
jgi:flagellar motor switch protein FliM